MNKCVTIIGAGASGLMAAITASKNGCNVTIIEKNDKPGKKILATGNGRCNLTNLNQDISNYNCNNISFVENILGEFDYENTIKFFENLGMLCKDKGGYIYPKSLQAQTVVDILYNKCLKENVKFCFNCDVLSINPYNDLKTYKIKYERKIIEYKKNKPIVTSKNVEFIDSEKIIIACGGMANKNLGSDGSGYKLAKMLNHNINTPLPALCGLIADDKMKKDFFSKAAGIRSDVKASILIDGKIKSVHTGELQIVDYGLSGIVIFQLSRFASKALQDNNKCIVSLDFLNDMEYDDIYSYIVNSCKRNNIKLRDALKGVINNKLADCIVSKLEQESNNKSLKIEQATSQAIKLLKNFNVNIVKTNDFERAQVCTGGIDVSQINMSLQSTKSNGIYFCGEILDVDGLCGGYNLQWAWSSGYVAGRSASFD